MKKILEYDSQLFSDFRMESLVPEKTNTYSPVSHRDVINIINEQADKNNLTITNSRILSNRTGQQVIGYFDIHPESDEPVEIGMRCVFRNSYDKSMSFAFAVGAVVWICSNGIITGEIQMKRKHTGTINEEILWKISEGFRQIGEHYERIITASEALIECEVSPTVNAELLGRMLFEESIITRLQAGIIMNEMLYSKYFHHVKEPDYNAFDLYMHVSEALKRSHPYDYLHNHIDLHTFMCREFNI